MNLRINSVQTVQSPDLQQIQRVQKSKGISDEHYRAVQCGPRVPSPVPMFPCCLLVFSLLNLKTPYGAHFLLCSHSFHQVNLKGGEGEEQNIPPGKVGSQLLAFSFKIGAFPTVKNSAFSLPLFSSF